MFEVRIEGSGAPAMMGDAELTEGLERLCAAMDELEAARLALLGEWDARAVYAFDGAPNGACWLASRGRLGRAEAAGMVRTARRLRTMPLTAAALADGSLVSAKARILARAINERTEAAFARDEEVLVAEVIALRVDEAANVVRYWAMRVDADGPDPGHDDDAVHLSHTLRGRWRLDGDLDGECGSILDSVLGQIADQLHEAAKGTEGPKLSGARLRAAALVEMARRASASSDERQASRPLVWVMADLSELRAGEGVGELVGSGPIGAESALRLACDAEVARVLLDGPTAVVDLGRTSRTASAVQHRLLAIRDRGCLFPGCDRPPGWCHAHHLTHWINGGPTDMDNLASLCSFHHHLVHEGHWGIHRSAEGVFSFTRPDGTPVTARPLAA